MYYIETETSVLDIEHHEMSSAELNINELYQWLDRPISEDEACLGYPEDRN
ncbi:MAG: hypothetical protein OEY89_12845 [Gammaproteobacteria bacterium]|nr:hypothetical protein [Gammaproteobacteria bacterium]